MAVDVSMHVTWRSTKSTNSTSLPTVYPYLLHRFEPVLTYSTRVAREQLDLLTFRPRDVYGKFHDFVRTFQKAAVTLTFAKRYTSKSSRYNATMRYASYSLHARLRFSRWMHEISSARFQSASWVKRRDFVRTFQKASQRRLVIISSQNNMAAKQDGSLHREVT